MTCCRRELVHKSDPAFNEVQSAPTQSVRGGLFKPRTCCGFNGPVSHRKQARFGPMTVTVLFNCHTDLSHTLQCGSKFYFLLLVVSPCTKTVNSVCMQQVYYTPSLSGTWAERSDNITVRKPAPGGIQNTNDAGIPFRCPSYRVLLLCTWHGTIINSCNW